jgi:thiol:disulfide interchange protein
MKKTIELDEKEIDYLTMSFRANHLPKPFVKIGGTLILVGFLAWLIWKVFVHISFLVMGVGSVNDIGNLIILFFGLWVFGNLAFHKRYNYPRMIDAAISLDKKARDMKPR